MWTCVYCLLTWLNWYCWLKRCVSVNLIKNFSGKTKQNTLVHKMVSQQLLMRLVLVSISLVSKWKLGVRVSSSVDFGCSLLMKIHYFITVTVDLVEFSLAFVCRFLFYFHGWFLIFLPFFLRFTTILDVNRYHGYKCVQFSREGGAYLLISDTIFLNHVFDLSLLLVLVFFILNPLAWKFPEKKQKTLSHSRYQTLF